MLEAPLSEWKPPAACQVEPAASSARSRRTTSVTPPSARCQAVAQPTMPPPMTTTSAWVFMVVSLVRAGTLPRGPAGRSESFAAGR